MTHFKVFSNAQIRHRTTCTRIHCIMPYHYCQSCAAPVHVALTNSVCVKGESESLRDTVHLVNTQCNGRGMHQQVVAMAIEVPCEYVSNFDNVLQENE